MKKVKLALDALLVESFEVEPAKSAKGTVHGHWSDLPYSCPAHSCGGYSCDSCIPCSEFDCTQADTCDETHPQCTFTCETACEQTCASCDSCELTCFCE